METLRTKKKVCQNIAQKLGDWGNGIRAEMELSIPYTHRDLNCSPLEPKFNGLSMSYAADSHWRPEQCNLRLWKIRYLNVCAFICTLFRASLSFFLKITKNRLFSFGSYRNIKQRKSILLLSFSKNLILLIWIHSGKEQIWAQMLS